MDTQRTDRGRVLAVLAAVVAVLATAACGAAEATDSRADPVPSDPPPPLTLFVSNQSFDDPTVGMQVTVDGEVVADRDFPVDDQHTQVRYALDLPAGEHTLVATADTGARISRRFVTEAGEPRWAYLSYWTNLDGRSDVLDLTLHDEAIEFG